MHTAHDAFISYSHTSDGRLAPALESGLEKLARPLFALRAIDVFRDETSLAANPGLWSTIVEHLSGSNWFLLLASPTSAASRWCNEEAAWWLDHRGAGRMLVVLTEGELVWNAAAHDFDWSATTALSPALRGRFTEEPLYVDLRWARQRDSLALSDLRFRAAILDLAAPIRGVPKDQLDGEDVRLLRRTKRIARAAVITIAAASVVAIWQAIEATRQRNNAIEQRDRALSRQLAAQASGLPQREPVIALLLAAQGYATSPSREAITELLRVLQAIPAERILELPNGLNSLAVAPDGKVAIVGDGAGQTVRIDIESGERSVLPGTPRLGMLKAVLAVAVSPDGQEVASGGFDQKILFWRGDGAAREIGAGREAHEGFIMGLAFSPDGSLLASAGTDGRVLIHDLRSDATRVLRPHSFADEMGPVSFSPDGRVLAVGGDKAYFDLHRLDDPPVARKQSSAASVQEAAPSVAGPGVIPSGSAESIAFTADGKQVACAYYDGVVDIYDVASGRLRERVDLRRFGYLEALALAPDGNLFVTGHADGSVVVWQRQPYQSAWQSRTLYRHLGAVKGAAFLPDHRRVVTIGFDGRAFISRPIDLAPLANPRARSAPSSASAGPNPDERTAPAPSERTLLAKGPGRHAFAHADGRVTVTIADDPERVVELLGASKQGVSKALFSTDGRTLFMLAHSSIRAWDADTGVPSAQSGQLDLQLVFLMAVSPDDKLLAIAGSSLKPDVLAAARREPEQRVMLFHADGLTPIVDSTGMAGSIGGGGKALYFTPDSRLLVLHTDGGLTLWDVRSLERFDEAVMLPGVAASYGLVGSESTLLVSGPASGTTLEVSLAPEQWAEQACKLARRALTRAEWARYVSRDLPYAPACRDGKLVSAVP